MLPLMCIAGLWRCVLAQCGRVYRQARLTRPCVCLYFAAESLPPPTLSSRRKDLEGANAIQVRGVTPLWMDVTPTERCAHYGTSPSLGVGYPTLPTSDSPSYRAGSCALLMEFGWFRSNVLPTARAYGSLGACTSCKEGSPA